MYHEQSNLEWLNIIKAMRPDIDNYKIHPTYVRARVCVTMLAPINFFKFIFHKHIFIMNIKTNIKDIFIPYITTILDLFWIVVSIIK